MSRPRPGSSAAASRRPRPTRHELLAVAMNPFLPPLRGRARAALRREVRSRGGPVEVLDVGGRKSPYTAMVPCEVTISDLPRTEATQHELHLGLTSEIEQAIKARRSNVSAVVLDDMTETKLDAASFDVVVSVEVIEHVWADEDFVSNIARVLRPDGAAILTTPNGRTKPEPTGDHKRHYRPEQLRDLLAAHFAEVEVREIIAGDGWRRRAMRSWTPRKPLRTLAAVTSGPISHLTSLRRVMARTGTEPQNLLAIARRPLVHQS